MKPAVLVAHSAYWIGIARLPVVLQEAGASVTIMCPKGGYLARTRFVDQRLPGSNSPAAFVDQLRAHLREREYSWVILADEALISELAKYADEERVKRILPLSSAAAFEMMGSKIAFLEVCKANDLPVAPSRTAQTLEEARAAADAITYPVMLKLPVGSGGVGVKKIDDPDALEREFASFSSGEALTVERFVAGLVGGAEILFDHGVPVCWSAYYKEKQWPGVFGPSAVRRVMDHPQIEDILDKLGAITGFHGFAVICFIHDTKRNDLTLLEMNVRPGVGMHFRGPIRRMFVGGVRALLAGRPYQGRRTPGAENQLIHMFPQDLYRSIAEHDFRGMIRLASGGVLQDLPYDDARLLVAHIRSIREETRSIIA